MATKYVVQTTVDDHVTVSDQTLVDAPSATVADGSITIAKLGGDITTAGKALLDDADNTAQRATLGLGASALNNETAQSARFGLVTGQYIDTQHDCTAHTTLAGAANRIDMTPFIPTRTFSIDRIGVNVTTGVASANVKIVIYSADANGWPDTRLYESGDLSAATSSTFVEATMSQTFTAGTIYWLGVRHSSTATLRAMPLASCLPLGLLSTTAAGPATVIRRTLTYATAATTPWVFTNTDRVAGVAPTSIRMRIA